MPEGPVSSEMDLPVGFSFLAYNMGTGFTGMSKTKLEVGEDHKLSKMNLQVACHHVSLILFIRSDSLGPVHAQRNPRKPGCQEVVIIEDSLKRLTAQLSFW